MTDDPRRAPEGDLRHRLEPRRARRDDRPSRTLPGSELGELQIALWRKQFEALRDGDRFFYANDPELEAIQREYGISYRHTLSELIALNTTKYGTLPSDVFYAPAPAHLAAAKTRR